MGKKVTIEYEDDLDGGTVDASVVVTVDFSYKGGDYSLVLNPDNGAQFDADMARWITAAKKAQTREARESSKKTAPAARRTPVAKTAPAARRTPAAKTAPAAKKTSAVSKAPAAKKAQSVRAGAAKPAPVAAAAPAAPSRGRKPAASTAPADQNRTIREWAVANGRTVSKRGRISAEVVEAFKAAH